MVNLPEILANSSAYPQFLTEKLWRLASPGLTCRNGSPKTPCHLIGWGTRTRRPKGLNGESLGEIKIQRFFCTLHRVTLSYVPPFLFPCLHYAASIVQEGVDRYVRGQSICELSRNFHRPDERTVRRWIASLKNHGDRIRKHVFGLLGKINHTFDEADYTQQKRALEKSPRPLALRGVWALLKTAATQLMENRFPYHYVLAGSS